MSETTWVKRRKHPEINIIPLVDVLIILIFFFLLTMRLQDFRDLQIQLPQIDSATTGAIDDLVRIGITAEGKFFLNEVAVSEEELAELLIELGNMDRRKSILILSDEEGTVRELARVIDLCRKAGLDRFRILSR